MTEPTLYPESGFLRLRLDIAYDGTNFSGWAKQPDRRTCQELLESTISKIARFKVETVVAGRTDAGVHATGQVVHVDVPENLDLEDLTYRINRIMDEDLRITKISIAPPAFHARFSALRRSYRYKILDNNQVIPPLNRADVAPWYRTLNLDLLNEASALLLGSNDFAAFSKFREGSTTVRNLEKFSWIRDSDGFLIADVVADAFCYSMVRNLVGAVACVAEGRFEPDWVVTTLKNRERISDSMVFPARGLTLYKVEYPPDSELLERVKITVAKRESESD